MLSRETKFIMDRIRITHKTRTEHYRNSIQTMLLFSLNKQSYKLKFKMNKTKKISKIIL